MADDVPRLLELGRFQQPDHDECARLQAYWDDLKAQAPEVGFGAAEIALRYAAWAPEDD